MHTIDITKEIEGEKKVKIRKSINNGEEEKAYTIKIDEKADGNMVFISDDGSTYNLKSSPDSDSLVWVGEDGKTKTITKEGKHTFTIIEGDEVKKIKMDVEEGNGHKMVFIKTDGETTTIKESDDDHVWISEEDGKQKVITRDDGKQIVIARADGDADVDIDKIENIMVTISEDVDSDKEIEVTIDVEEESDASVEKKIKKVIVVKGEDGNYTTNIEELDDIEDDTNTNVWVQKIKEGDEKKTITIEMIKEEEVDISVSDIVSEDNEFDGFDMGDYKPLKLKSLNCDPNPSDGQFTLSFSASSKPLSVRIFDKSGEKVFYEKVEDHGGNYSKEIDLRGKSKGLYVLQISQGGKAVNKKLQIK